MAGHIERAELDGRLHDVARRLNEDSTAPWCSARSLGMAWRCPAGPGVKSFLYQELRSRLVRRQLGLRRLPLLGARPLGQLATHALRVDRFDGPRLGSADSVLVLGRSRTKLLDYVELTATAIEMPGRSTIPQEQRAREGCGDFTTTELIRVQPEDGVFIERLETGFNLAVYGTATHLIPKVCDLLERWRADRFRVVSAKEHLRSIESDIGEASLSDEWQLVRKVLDDRGTIELELSHGDLQPANVFSGSSGLRLLDFEHLEWRTAGYDLATFTDSLRWKGRSLEHLEPWLAAEQYRWATSRDS